MIKVIITSPSMNISRNVSGVSSVVIQIKNVLSSKVEFIPLEVGSEHGKSYFETLFGSIYKIVKAIFAVLTVHYDLIHSNTAMNPKSIIRDLIIIATARLRGKGILLHVHGGKYVHEKAPPVIQFAMWLLFQLSDKIIVLSHTELAYISNSFPLCATKIDFIYNGTNLSELSIDRSKNSASNLLKVVFVGRLVPEKGIKFLIEASEKLGYDNDIAIDFFGDGVLLPAVIALTKEKSFVKYGGIFQPTQCREVLQDYDVLVLPSISGEGMPMAMIEAMSVGVIPVCSPLSSIPEIVSDGITGMLLASGSADSIVTALNRLKADPNARKRMSQAALEFALDKFDAHKNFGNLLNFYKQLTN